MLMTLAVQNYRSLHSLEVPLSRLTVITGANGAGKSNLYGALRLLVNAANGDVVAALAREGGLPNVMWAGPEKISRAMERGEVPVQGSPRQNASRIKLGFGGEQFGYLIELGMPTPMASSAFNLDPVIKRESIWHGQAWRQASVLVDRKGPLVRRRSGRQWQVVASDLAESDSLFSHAGDPASVPEVFRLREMLRHWRFYADFRTDAAAPARQSIPATRTPVLHHDGRDLAAALQTIIEVGEPNALHEAIDDAFPGSRLGIERLGAGQLQATLTQPGLLRALNCSEWSDGTLRYVLLVAALLTPRPPPLMVLNEPETSLHPELVAPLARLIGKATERSQVWIISHSRELVRRLEIVEGCSNHILEKSLGRTVVSGLAELDKPPWRWG
ncbi:AAA family ATPase [Granulosicoccus antarcticus]|uniref:DNA replication and repair protein RecF n=1 Tax=Granulosicoccus antarcticus IMCC3135 TaxID=1192854 RepID=A0A2Z2NTU2_9GAMM|nr:AAA family ATPase [Granulosicoccus antarcticus]ASJ70534.1 DNA replication and repair protein RecF [Granulosicoccus antarcticus IMCC3135]